MNPFESGAVIDMNMGRNRATPAPVGADALREALWICVEHNALHFGETHNTVVQGRAALASAAQRDLLRDFARAVMQAWPEGGIDGGELQDIALAHGLLRPAEPPTDWDGCNFYERTELIK